ncbi:MAG: Fpg/Nei family DNA glycosylase [Mucilaginibacter sp.]|nr:Fpg/Nei family DNA glycosylase [Mucilaginibacter sp.]
MPEIPDLNIFQKNLAAKLVGQRLVNLSILIERRLKRPVAEFKSSLEGAKLLSIDRVGKELHFGFDNGHTLGLHLMLYGEMHWFEGVNENRFPIAELMFENGTGLAICDWQKSVILTLDPEASKVPDALAIPSGYLANKLAKSAKVIKTVLTDGKVIGGIGNAYVDEILYEAKVSPLSIASKLPKDVIAKIEQAIQTVLTEAEKHIFGNYPDTISEKERDFLQVHRPKQTLTLSGEEILKTEIDKRKTYYTAGQQLFE